MASTMVEEFVFKVDYLGSVELSKQGTGLGTVQKPLRELYLDNIKKAGTKLRTQERSIKVRTEGLLMTYVDSTSSNQRHGWYDMSSIHYVEAVKFTGHKRQDKKIKAVFEPLDEKRRRNTNMDSFTSILDKKYMYLTERSHPPLFVCILRRPSGVKALDAHVFIMASEKEAMQIVGVIDNIQNPGEEGETSSSGYGASHSTQDKPDPSPRGQDYHKPAHHMTSNSGQLKYELRDDHFRPSYDYNYNSDHMRDAHSPTGDQYNRFAKEGQLRSADDRRGPGHGAQRPFSMDPDDLLRHDEEMDARLKNIRTYSVDDNSVNQRHHEHGTSDVGSHMSGSHSNKSGISLPTSRRSPRSTGPSMHLPMLAASASNLESRQQMERIEKSDSFEDNKHRPVAKVPPHLIAGVKVLPTDFKIPAKKPPHDPSPSRDLSPRESHQPYPHRSDHPDTTYENHGYHAELKVHDLKLSETSYHDPGYHDPHYHDQKNHDSKFQDSKYHDSKYGDQRNHDSKFSDSKYSDSKHGETKYIDSKYQDSKYQDAKYHDSKHYDPHYPQKNNEDYPPSYHEHPPGQRGPYENRPGRPTSGSEQTFYGKDNMRNPPYGYEKSSHSPDNMPRNISPTAPLDDVLDKYSSDRHHHDIRYQPHDQSREQSRDHPRAQPRDPADWMHKQDYSHPEARRHFSNMGDGGGGGGGGGGGAPHIPDKKDKEIASMFSHVRVTDDREHNMEGSLGYYP